MDDLTENRLLICSFAMSFVSDEPVDCLRAWRKGLNQIYIPIRPCRVSLEAFIHAKFPD